MRPILLTLAAIAAYGQDLKIVSGITDRQVLQRDAGERGGLKLAGTAAAKANGKFVEARVVWGKGSEKTGAIEGFDWTPLIKVKNGTWNGEVKGLPTGGPYRVEVRITGSAGVAAADEILVGDLWVLAGQSNMEGVGDLVEVQAGHPLIHAFNQSEEWVIAEEPLHWKEAGVYPVHWRKNAEGKPERMTGAALEKYRAERKKGAGLGLPFAAEMLRRTGVPVGLLACAHGGTSMDQWSPALKDKGGESLYGAMVRRVAAAGGNVKGVLWYQGESDANPKAAPQFAAKFQALIEAVRKDFGAPELPFYYVQIGRHVNTSNAAEWNAVQEAQRQTEAKFPKIGMAASVDFLLDDTIHVSTPEQKRLGRRLANLATRDLFPDVKQYAGLKAGPRPVTAKVEGAAVRVKFDNVNGALQSEGRLSGFTLLDAEGKPAAAVYKMIVDPSDQTSVLIYFAGKLPEGAVLWYGMGKDPYCNLRDSADMGVPVFRLTVEP